MVPDGHAIQDCISSANQEYIAGITSTALTAKDARISELEAEVALCRKRLGPAGYKILTDFKELEAAARKAEGALEKLKDGPGNKMAFWQCTWAHDFSSKALAELRKVLK